MFNHHRFTLVPLTGILLLAGLNGCKHSTDSSSGDPIDLSARDTTVRPQDDFFSYASGDWIKKTEIPASLQAWGSFQALREQNLQQIHGIMDSLSRIQVLAKGSPEQLVGDFYGSIMDSAGIEAKGYTPLKEDLARISTIKDVPGVLDEVVKEYRDGGNVLFSFSVGPDDKNSIRECAHVDQGGLGLPNKSYYFNQDSAVLNIKKAYQAYAARIFSLIGDDSMASGKEAESVLSVEAALAKSSRTPVELRDPHANYHKLTLAELDQLTPGLQWDDLLTKLGVHQDSILAGQPEFLTGMNAALKTLPLDAWKNYLRFHLINQFSGLLSTPFVDARYNYDRSLTGQKEPFPRWKRASQLVDGNLGDALGQLYVKQYFPPEAKQRVEELVSNIVATLGEHIRHLDWMSDSTKQKALAKLNAVTRKVGYPDKWKDYAGVDIDKNDAVANLRNCKRYEYKRQISKIGKPVDRSEWEMTPPTVNAYYEPTQNNINFPAGILQPPFFFKDGDDAVNYGAIGFVIGHEISHGFDDEGRQYDGDGNLKDWWSPEDMAHFKQKANLVVRQYDSYIVVDTFHLNGNLTLGENLADVGGISIAYGAFKKATQGKDTTLIDGLTPDQRFFLAYAQVWRGKYRPQALKTQVLTNPHSTPQWRTDGPVSDLNAFYDTYHLQPGDKMYLPDSLRAHIW